MSVAEPFTTDGLYNGFPSCSDKVNILDRGDGNPYEYWTTLSGWSAINEPTTAADKKKSVQNSTTNAAKLLWSLEEITVDVQYPSGGDTLPDMNVNGSEWVTGDALPVEPSIPPKDRVCGGSLSEYNDNPFADFVTGQIDLTQEIGIQRLYKGVTTDEANFIGYGGGLIDWGADVGFSTEWAPISVSAFDGGIADTYVGLGGYLIEPVPSGRLEEVAYVVVEGLSFVFHGLATDAGVDGVVDSTNLLAEITSGGSLITRSQITSLEFYTYP